MSDNTEVHVPVVPNWHSDRSDLGFPTPFCDAFSHSPREQEPSGIAAAADYLGARKASGAHCTMCA